NFKNYIINIANEEFVYIYYANEINNFSNDCENIYLNSLLVSKDNIKQILKHEKQGCSCIGKFSATSINVNGQNVGIYRIFDFNQYGCMQFKDDFINYFQLKQMNGFYFDGTYTVACINNVSIVIRKNYLKKYLEDNNLAILLYGEYRYYSNSFECEQIGLIEENDHIIYQECIKDFTVKLGYKITNRCIVKSILKI
ncbi:hypothetical protein AVANS14531_01350, partial [Campylobacter sp. Cr9]|uniref:hypothetical protein n=1 Tax=Campylobacter sp. Cr9 TaxID=2735728 RepID=UPI0030145F72|nr:hypothetical protein [Campylobacter sp. Cr9]